MKRNFLEDNVQYFLNLIYVEGRAEIIVTPPPSQIDDDKLIDRLDVYFL